MNPQNYFIVGYFLGALLTLVLCIGYMKKFKVDKKYGELIYLKDEGSRSERG